MTSMSKIERVDKLKPHYHEKNFQFCINLNGNCSKH
jgi:hypothetical protein